IMLSKSNPLPVLLSAALLLWAGLPVAARPAQSHAANGSLLAKADAAYHEGHLDDARRWLEEVIRSDPRSAGAQAALARFTSLKMNGSNSDDNLFATGLQ